MQAQAPQLGTYQVLNVYYEIHNGKPTPVADVIFKGQNWTKFDFRPRKLRLRALYNISSLGPKEQFKKDNIQSLYLHMIEIINKIEQPDPKDPIKMIYSLEWCATKPFNYEQLIQQDMEFEGDFILQQQADALHEAELCTIEMEDLITQQNLDDELATLEEDENSGDNDEDDFSDLSDLPV